MEETGKQQREKMLLQAAFEKSLLKKRRDDLPPSVAAADALQMAHSSALQQKVCSPLARSPKSSSSPAPLHPMSTVSIAREPKSESNPKPKSWFILAIRPGFGSSFRSGWRIHRSAMNEKASVSKELNTKHKKRAADQSSSRAMELEHKVAVLEVECASLHQELQEMEACNRRAQKKPSKEANQVLQVW